jgi:hypothetical protein
MRPRTAAGRLTRVLSMSTMQMVSRSEVLQNVIQAG